MGNISRVFGYYRKEKLVMDVGAMIGHGPIRSYVMGHDKCQGKEDASEEEMEEMAKIQKAIEAGALGFSTSEHIYTRINLESTSLEQKPVLKR